MVFSLGSIITGIVNNVVEVFLLTWWFLVPIALAIIFFELWMFYIENRFIANIKWSLLRVKTPKEILKTPKAMEQIFAAAPSTYIFFIKFN